MKIKLLRLFLLLFFFPLYSYGNSCTSIAGTYASWASVSWTCTTVPTSGPPGCGDVMNIGAGSVVNVSADVDYSSCGSPITLNIYGVLNFPTNGVRFKLPAGSTVFVGLGGAITKTFPGGGSSTLISVGGVDVWTAGDGAIVGPKVLPIELLSFTASPESHSVKLDWSTATELNNDYYTVERSTNGSDFKSIGTVDGSGTTNTVLHYSLEDSDPQEGTAYYRLRQTDFNGHTATFNVLAVEFHNSVDFSMNVFPNPSDGNDLTVLLNSEEQLHAVIRVYDMVGRIMYSREVITAKKGDNSILLDFSDRLAGGVYSVSCVSGEHAHVSKLVVQ
jgi:hypothetical protein